MKKIMFSLGFAALALGATAQVKIKDGSVSGTSSLPNTTAILDLESSNKGLHLPRVSLQATNNPAPLLNETSFSTMDSGLIVYNLATAGTAPYNVTPGVYYCDGTQWVRATGKPDWLIFGNANSAVNGTPAGNTDSQYVMGRVAIGTNTAPRIYSTAAGGDSAHKFAYLTTNGDASINGITVGQGGGQNSSNTVLGNQSLWSNTTGSSNVAIGYEALYSNTTGLNNVAVGNALFFNTSGLSNVAVGLQALYQNTRGGDNTAVGTSALRLNTTGSQNVAVGEEALFVSTGNSNTALGYYAGINQTSGNGNIVIGATAFPLFSPNSPGINLPNLTGNYQLNIGNVIYGTGVDSVATATAGAGNIGINVAVPTSTFQVGGSVSTPVNVQSNDYELLATDYTVIFTGTIGGFTATLPLATGITGRIYRIVNQSGGNLLITSASGITFLNGTTNLASTAAASFQAVNGIWYQIGQ